MHTDGPHEHFRGLRNLLVAQHLKWAKKTGTLAKYFRETLATTLDTKARICQFFRALCRILRATGFIIRGQFFKDSSIEIRKIRVEVGTK